MIKKETKTMIVNLPQNDSWHWCLEECPGSQWTVNKNYHLGWVINVVNWKNKHVLVFLTFVNYIVWCRRETNETITSKNLLGTASEDSSRACEPFLLASLICPSLRGGKEFYIVKTWRWKKKYLLETRCVIPFIKWNDSEGS